MIWLCAYGRHQSGAPEDAFPYFKQFEAEGRLLPRPQDYEKADQGSQPTVRGRGRLTTPSGYSRRSALPAAAEADASSGGYDHRYTQPIKTAVSIPDSVFQAADGLAQRLGVSRSELYARAVSRFIVEHRDDGVTEALDRVYEKETSQVDPALYALQAGSLGDDHW